MKISGLAHRLLAWKAVRYAMVSIFGYLFVACSMLFLVEHMMLGEKPSYALTLAAIYPISYLMNVHFVFHTKDTKRIRWGYIGYLVANYALTNALFWTLSSFKIHYLLSSILAMAILVPARFLAQSILVFTQKP